MPKDDDQEDIHVEWWWKWIFFISILVCGHLFVTLDVNHDLVIFVGLSRLWNTLWKDTEQNGIVVVSDPELWVCTFLSFLLFCLPQILENRDRLLLTYFLF